MELDGLKEYKHEHYIENQDLYKSRAKRWRESNKDRANRNASEWAKRNPERRALIVLRHDLKKYNITTDQYFDLLQKQNGVCAICRLPERNFTSKESGRLAIDHHHKTGQVRGLLCKGCNLAIGSMEESKERLVAAIHYLEEFDGK